MHKYRSEYIIAVQLKEDKMIKMPPLPIEYMEPQSNMYPQKSSIDLCGMFNASFERKY